MLTIHSDRDFDLTEIANLVRSVESAENDRMYYPRIIAIGKALSTDIETINNLIPLGNDSSGVNYYLKIQEIDTTDIHIYNVFNMNSMDLEFLKAFYVLSRQAAKAFYLKYKRELLQIFKENASKY